MQLFFQILTVSLMVEISVVGQFLPSQPLWFRLSYPYLFHPLRGFAQAST